jgi:lysozyme family protein
MTAAQIIDGVLRREGDRYTNHPADRGGPTRWGITLTAWREYKQDPSLQAADVERITQAEAREFYAFVHIRKPRFDLVVDESLRELLIDAGVNHGVRQSVLWIQRAAGVTADGVLGPISLEAINAAAPLALFLEVAGARLRLYGLLTSRDPELKRAKLAGIRLQAENTAGWCNRLAEFLEQRALAETTRLTRSP